MIVSWNWLKDYVALDMSVEELETRLMMAGLNHEGTDRLADDVAIDLEVTSNRPDCLGHVGVAREVAVLWNQDLKIPQPNPTEGKTPVADLTSVEIDCLDLCYRYTARVIQGVKIGPSPDWLVKRLKAIDRKYNPINNVVDITNYVLFECGQPLHAFDLDKLEGQKIIVRQARKGEPFEAIDHKTYELEAGMCVIADAKQPVALGGVMGGADTEVGDATVNLLIESAEFAPLSVRSTARKLNLHSPSSYRFERRVDPVGVDWASRRCCEMILDLAGGELAQGVIDLGQQSTEREPITLRFSQLKRILGIEIAADEVRKIFSALGMQEESTDADVVTVIPPTWRRDLTREIDLVEEAARIHGYDQIPEDVGVAMVPSAQADEDRLIDRLRGVLTSSGFNEAMTISAVEESWSEAFSPWTDQESLRCLTPVLRRADRLRRSLVPSLLGSRRVNETLANDQVELFEVANVYLPQKQGLPQEFKMLTLASGHGFLDVKGIVEALVEATNPATKLEVADTQHDLFAPGRSVELLINGKTLGYLGEVSPQGLKQFDLRNPATVAEIRVSSLLEIADLVPKQRKLSTFPAVSRDLNVVFEEKVRWADVEPLVLEASGEHLENLTYQDTYRDAKRLGPGLKSLLFSVSLRSHTGTLTREEADAIRDRVVDSLAIKLGGKLRA